ncbi:MAG: MarR family transcriptional regulator [Candidatus Omnitrophica bacterium]|nr:MarR family transcriptional regulator [Candidatus Omnitrophota bacterium]MDD5429624.1 MarR family transcriptional regulator [Candidatus Omnitrophota bacterium]
MSPENDISSFSQEMIRNMSNLVRFAHSEFNRASDVLIKGTMTLPQFFVLKTLDSGKSLKMKDIARNLHISLPAVTGFTNKLVKMNMLKRTYDKKDRRVIHMVLTDLGKKTLASIEESRKKFIEKIFGRLSNEERATYLKIMHKVTRDLYSEDVKK